MLMGATIYFRKETIDLSTFFLFLNLVMPSISIFLEGRRYFQKREENHAYVKNHDIVKIALAQKCASDQKGGAYFELYVYLCVYIPIHTC